MKRARGLRPSSGAREGLVIAVGCMLALGACTGCDDPPALASLAPLLATDVDLVDFGAVWVGDRAERTIWLSNPGTAPLTMGPVVVEGSPGFAVSPVPDRLAPEQTFPLSLVFAPPGEGASSAHLVLRADDGEEPRRIPLTALGLEPTACVDDNPCRSVAFDFDLGACVPSFVDGPCDDENACTADDRCAEGECRGAAVACPDPGGCVLAACSATAGCLAEPLDDLCPDDDNPCTVARCQDDGSCAALVLDDYTPCTAGLDCAGGIGVCLAGACELLPTDGWPCSDGDLCTTGDTCAEGLCAPGAATSQPPALLGALPLFVVDARTRAVGPHWLTPSALGTAIWESAPGGEILLRSVVAGVRCAGRPLALPDDLVVCATDEDDPSVAVIDLALGEAVLSPLPELPPPMVGPVDPQLFLHDGALFLILSTGFGTFLLRAEDPAAPVFVAALNLPGYHLARQGGHWLALWPHGSTGADGPEDGPGVTLYDLDSFPPEVWGLPIYPGLIIDRIDDERLLGRAGSSPAVVELAALETIPSAAGGWARGTPVLVDGFAAGAFDFLEGAVLGLNATMDAVVAMPVRPGVPVPAPLPVEDARRFREVGARRWEIAPGRFVRWGVAGLAEEVRAGPLAPAWVVDDDDGVRLVHAHVALTTVTDLALPGEMGVGFGESRRTGAAATFASLLFGRRGGGYTLTGGVYEPEPLLSVSRVVGGEVSPLGTTSAIGYAPFGVAGDLVAVSTAGEIVARRWDEGAQALVDLPPLPIGPPEPVAGSEEWVASPLVFDAGRPAVARVRWAQRGVEPPAFDADAGTELRSAIEVSMLDLAAAPAVRTATVEPDAGWFNFRVDATAHEGQVVVMLRGQRGTWPDDVGWAGRLFLLTAEGDGLSLAEVPFAPSFPSPTTIFQLVSVTDAAVHLLVDRRLLRFDREGLEEVALVVDLPEDPTSVLVQPGAVFAAGPTTLSVVRPACP